MQSASIISSSSTSSSSNNKHSIDPHTMATKLRGIWFSEQNQEEEEKKRQEQKGKRIEMERLHQRDRGEGEGQKKKRKREEGEEGEEEVHALFQPQPYILPWSSAATAWRHPPDSSTTFTPCRASTLLGTARSLHPTSLPAHVCASTQWTTV